MHHLVIVGSIIIRDGKMLLVQEAKPEAFEQWNFPGGRLDEGENVIAGAVRETKEETGYDVVPESLAMIHSPASKLPLFFLFNMKITGGEIEYDKTEILDVRWVPLAEVKNLKLRNSLAQLIDEILRQHQAGESYPLSLIKDIS
jgi:ADP-ribose pyrophosphatase YjhB (NUDIX family)